METRLAYRPSSRVERPGLQKCRNDEEVGAAVVNGSMEDRTSQAVMRIGGTEMIRVEAGASAAGTEAGLANHVVVQMQDGRIVIVVILRPMIRVWGQGGMHAGHGVGERVAGRGSLRGTGYETVNGAEMNEARSMSGARIETLTVTGIGVTGIGSGRGGSLDVNAWLAAGATSMQNSLCYVV